MMAILAEASLRSLFVAAAVWALIHAFRLPSARVRHAAWTAVLLTMLASPLLALWRPELPVRLPAVTFAVMTPIDADRPVAVEPRTDDTVAAAAPPVVEDRAVQREREQVDRPPHAATVPLTPDTRTWHDVAIVLWITGVVGGALHMLIGWRQLRRLASSCAPVDASHIRTFTTTTVVESPAVVTPVVLGIRHPRIVLPTTWTTWSDDDLRAILVHETSHLERRDTLVALLARVNRTVFWFHPLAWWLERTLALAAEQACDDAVVARRGHERSYADLLVRLASSASASGGRVAWHAIGVNGGGSLETRIDRLLSGAARQPVSRRRATALATVCSAVIVAGVACQQQPAPLQPDPEREALWTTRDERMNQWRAATTMTAEQVAAMEARAAADPSDINATLTLLTFYQQRGQAEYGWNAMIDRRRPHLLRLIQHHPDAEGAGRRIIETHDPAGYAQARSLWLAHVSRPDASAAALANAASFFSVSEKPLAEELLLRASAIDADGPQSRRHDGIFVPAWPQRLGELYALAILGSNDALESNVVRSIDQAAARSPFATRARATLDATDNASILVAAGRLLMLNASHIDPQLDFDVAMLGRTYLDRALVLDPSLDVPRTLLMVDEGRVRSRRVWEFVKNAGANLDSALDALPESDRLTLFADLTDLTYIGAGGPYWPRDDEEQGQRRARRIAEAALQLAAKHPSHPDYGMVIHRANITLGTLAIREGDRRTAVAHLRAAAASPASEEIAWRMPAMAHQHLVHALLDAGERESVAAYFDRLAEMTRVGSDRWRADAVAIREGRMPESYQAAKRTVGASLHVR